MMTKESVLRIYSDFFNLFEGFKILRTAQILLNIPDNKLGFEQRLKLINEANPDLDIDFLTKLIDTFEEININNLKSNKDFNTDKERYDYYFNETRKKFGYDVE